ncbi:MAG: hypothetical protein ABL888_03440 [Pirellulaceae bacterium]
MKEQSDSEFDFEETLVTPRTPPRRRSLFYVLMLGVALVIIALIATNIAKYFTQPPPTLIGSVDIYVGWIVTLPSGKYYQIVKSSDGGYAPKSTVAWIKYVDHVRFVNADNEFQQFEISTEGDRISFWKVDQRVESVRLLSQKLLTTEAVSGTSHFQIPNLANLTDAQTIEEITKHFTPDDLEPDLVF